MSRKKERPQIKVEHYMMIDGEIVPIDPSKTDLPDRCLLALAEILTGQRFKLVDPNLQDESGS